MLVAEGEDPNPMSRRDVVEWMDRFGLVPDAPAAREAVALRNRLTHAYPMQPDRQAAGIEEAPAQAPLLLDCVTWAEARLARRGAVPGGAGA